MFIESNMAPLSIMIKNLFDLLLTFYFSKINNCDKSNFVIGLSTQRFRDTKTGFRQTLCIK